MSAGAAHIRHLAKASALEDLLRERHGFAHHNASLVAKNAVPFLEQGLIFYDTSQAAPLRARSVLQYYAYLNLAVALILIYRPTGWEGFKKHGAEDLSRSLSRISLSSPVIRLRSGALSLFHSIICNGQLPEKKMTLRDLLIPIPMVASELEHAFGICPRSLLVSGQVQLFGEGENQTAKSCFKLELNDPTVSAKFPLRRIYQVMPELKSKYKAQERTGTIRTFHSVQSWTPSNRIRADRFHEEMAFRFFNLGGQQMASRGTPVFAWMVGQNSQLLPALTAGILLSFVLASLSRYRANILDRVENSKINLLLEVFENEADGFMIPAMRNLLYSETFYVERQQFI